MHRFRWLSDLAIPPEFDLRRGGWRLVSNPIDQTCPSLAPISAIDQGGWIMLLGIRGRRLREKIMLTGVKDREERARLLRLGFGDVVDESPGLGEIEARVLRISDQAELVPRFRQIGPLRLDLIERDGMVDKQRLNLHPREFALIWRLSDTPGKPVRKTALLSDVWRLTFIPDTNSLAVHVFRLRAKLAPFGLDGLVQTAASGGYVLSNPPQHDFTQPRNYHDDALLLLRETADFSGLDAS